MVLSKPTRNTAIAKDIVTSNTRGVLGYAMSDSAVDATDALFFELLADSWSWLMSWSGFSSNEALIETMVCSDLSDTDSAIDVSSIQRSAGFVVDTEDSGVSVILRILETPVACSRGFSTVERDIFLSYMPCCVRYIYEARSVR